jgi:hypothetical protein
MGFLDFQCLRHRARTADDFLNLAAWCRATSELYRKRQRLGHDYGELSRHWHDLAMEYADRACQLANCATEIAPRD